MWVCVFGSGHLVGAAGVWSGYVVNSFVLLVIELWNGKVAPCILDTLRLVGQVLPAARDLARPGPGVAIVENA